MSRCARLLVLGLVALCASCAGPTVSDSALLSQASRSAQTAVSQLQTVDLAVRTQQRGDAWWSYTDVVVTSSEDALTSVEGTFDSRQPPSRTTDAAYRRTAKALADASELVTQIRISVRRGDLDSLRRQRARIAPLVKRLERLEGLGR